MLNAAARVQTHPLLVVLLSWSVNYLAQPTPFWLFVSCAQTGSVLPLCVVTSLPSTNRPKAHGFSHFTILPHPGCKNKENNKKARRSRQIAIDKDAQNGFHIPTVDTYCMGDVANQKQPLLLWGSSAKLPFFKHNEFICIYRQSVREKQAMSS